MEIVQVLITQWDKGVFIVDPVAKFSARQRKKLQQFGFTDSIDKLIVKIATVTNDRTIVSDDCDFWDPTNKANYQNKNAPVARLLREELGVAVLVLGVFMPLLQEL